MKRLGKLKLNTQLLAVFFAAVLLLSLGHFFVYSYLLNTMQREEDSLSQERMGSAIAEMSNCFDDTKAAYVDVLGIEKLKTYNGTDQDMYSLSQIQHSAAKTLDRVGYIHSWFIMLEGFDKLISKNGIITPESYFDNLCKSDTYGNAFWQARLQDTQGKHFFPADVYYSLQNNGNKVNLTLMPLTVSPGGHADVMIVLLLDMRMMCQMADAYMQSGIYFFDEDAELLYTTDETPVIGAIPTQSAVTDATGKEYMVLQSPVRNGPVCVKLLPESEATALLRNNLVVCFGIALGTILLVMIFIPRSVKNMMAPVNQMVNLVRQHATPQEENLHDISRELEQILKSKEQQAVALAQRDAALSQYVLHSKLKNVYVDAEQKPEQQDADTYILYIQVQYQEKSRGNFGMSRAELENCIQEMMSFSLKSLFDTTMIFQLEPGRFAARVTLPPSSKQIDDLMEKFMQRLEQEQEFACFVVVRSQLLQPEDDLAAIYTQVQETARQALVTDKSQLLTLPLSQKNPAEFAFPPQDEQQLDALVRSGQLQRAVNLAEQILRLNLQRGITHAQMEILCVALVHTAVYAISEQVPSAEKITAASGVYSTLTSKCVTAREYIETVSNFILSIEETQTPDVPEQDQLLVRIRQYLKENYYREFSSEEMASDLWVSRSYLSSYYKNKTGMNLSNSIQMFRIQKAVELLKDPNIKIGDVGPMVGMPSSNTFLRQFRKYTGMTPKEYRQKNTE